MFFPYRTESLRPALTVIPAVVILVILMPNPVLQVLAALLISGPLAWIALQLARAGRGIHISETEVEFQTTLLRRVHHLDREQIQALLVTPRDGLALAYWQPRKAEPGEEPRPPKLKLFISDPLVDPDAALDALSRTASLSEAKLRTLLTWRRVRRLLLAVLSLFVLLPALIVIIIHIAISFGHHTHAY